MDAGAFPVSGNSIFDESPCGLLVTEANGVIRQVNPMFCRWVGYQADRLVGMRLQDLLTIGCRVFHQTHWAPLLQLQGSLSEVKLEAVHSSGHPIPMLFSVIRKRHGSLNLDYVAVMVVTDREKYEAELLRQRRKAEEAQAMLARTDQQKDEFLATLGHELRNPLAAMRNVIEILKRTAPGEPKLVWGRDVLDRQVTLLSRLVDDLLEVSRVNQGKLDLRKQVINLASPVRVAIEAIEPLIRSAGQSLIVTLSEQAISIDADPVRITQVVQNILNNASKYTPEGGKIWLSVGIDGSDAFVSVRDTGIGIPVEQQEQIFSMFSQLEPALKRAQGGLGIGLALVRALVLLHSGTVEVMSAGAGQGSEFTVRLPISRSSEEQTCEPRAPSAPKARSRNILIIDDNEDSAQTLGDLLELAGHQATVAHNGPDGLAAAGRLRPDVVVLDIGLPGMNGYEVARRIRAEPWGALILLIALTGWGQPQDKREAEAAGFDHHVTKPFDIDALDGLLQSGHTQTGPANPS